MAIEISCHNGDSSYVLYMEFFFILNAEEQKSMLMAAISITQKRGGKVIILDSENAPLNVKIFKLMSEPESITIQYSYQAYFIFLVYGMCIFTKSFTITG